MLGKPARTFGHANHSHAKDCPGHKRESQHPTPPTTARESVVDQVGCKDADRYGELKERHLPTPRLRRRYLRDIDRYGAGGEANTQPHAQPAPPQPIYRPTPPPNNSAHK